MNEQERQIITDIFRRLEQVAHQARDPETERFIAEKVRQQPYAPYAMAQSLFVQEQALMNLNAEVERLRAEVEQLRRQPQGGGGFLSSIFGGGAARHEHPRTGSPWGGRPAPYGQQPYGAPQGGMMGHGHQPYGAPQGGMMGHGQQPYGAPQGGMMGAPGPWGGMQPRGGGFLQSAMATAAGVAGGVMIANALSSAFGGDHGAANDPSALAGAGFGGEETTGGITDSLYQDAGNAAGEESDFGGGDGGDGGDWA